MMLWAGLQTEQLHLITQLEERVSVQEAKGTQFLPLPSSPGAEDRKASTPIIVQLLATGSEKRQREKEAVNQLFCDCTIDATNMAGG